MKDQALLSNEGAYYSPKISRNLLLTVASNSQTKPHCQYTTDVVILQNLRTSECVGFNVELDK